MSAPRVQGGEANLSMNDILLMRDGILHPDKAQWMLLAGLAAKYIYLRRAIKDTMDDPKPDEIWEHRR